MLPVKDLNAARRFYEETLGLDRAEEITDEVILYGSGDSRLCVYRSAFAGTNEGTAATWVVEDVEGTVDELKATGVVFEHYDDLPAMTRGGDVHVAGEMRVAWFKDPSGNILSIQNA